MTKNDYLQQYKILHTENNYYGASSLRYLDYVCMIIDYLKPKVVLDFGCGKAALIKELTQRYPTIEFYGYDPAIPGRNILPIEKADLVVNTDVLEHIPEDALPEVIAKIASISDNAFFVLHHALARQILPNGQNAHCTVKPPQWYYELFSKYFKNPYPLPSKDLLRSAVITFTPSVDFLNTYSSITRLSPIVVMQENRKIIPYRLGKLISYFIPKKKNRKHFREKYVQTKKG
ncbi:MAG: class I SAM-dependent methyltransferase [Heliobacteriaceae bacterium]|jgi:hypothetical protein|nr:class I SAM-dependent methyltransferase [Heliobacteriaceae bacterium]